MEETIRIGPYTIPAYHFDVLIAGSGAAGLNAADTLFDEGVRNIAIVTDNLKAGTSRNTGSDKQTYYKLSLGGAEEDSVRALAQTLFNGQCADGDIALCEAAASIPCFMKLVRLGVPFPKNLWGEYVGYKTDHDPARRATSAGPYTSRFMTEALEAQVLSKKIKIFEHYQIIRLLTRENSVAGLLCFDLKAHLKFVEEHKGDKNIANSLELGKLFTVFFSNRIIWATGGPATIYDNTVYPESQNGATGAAFEAGALGRNLTEWQYGLASIKPRWNVSGTFMQVLPRFISSDLNGKDEKEFLTEYFNDPAEMLTCVFLKGYQWPFDSRKIGRTDKGQGSSIIDILVYLESAKGRRVFLDFRNNPLGQKELDFSTLSLEARSYLEASHACFGSPYKRLVKMNTPAVEFYKSRGVDLSSEPLEIALCAQHNNGGLAVDHWWRSNIEGLFPVGEAAATHGVYRPGGSALNAGQAGSFRAALFIARDLSQNEKDVHVYTEPLGSLKDQILEIIQLSSILLSNDLDNTALLLAETRKRMSLAGGAFRDGLKISHALEEIRELKEKFSLQVGTKNDLPLAFRLRDTLICQEFYLSAMADYISQSGKSRGSALYHN